MEFFNKTQIGFRSLRALIFLLLVIVLFLVVYFLVSPKNHNTVQTLTRDGIVTDIQKLNRLQSTAYQVETIVTASKQGTWQKLWQDEQKGLFVIKGRVLAGIDLSQMDSHRVLLRQQDEKTHIQLTLPPSQIFEVFLDDIEIYDWQTGLFGTVAADSALFTQVQNDAKAEVLRKACQGDVLNVAMQQAAEQMKRLFTLTQASVDVVTQGVGACQMPNK